MPQQRGDGGPLRAVRWELLTAVTLLLAVWALPGPWAPNRASAATPPAGSVEQAPTGPSGSTGQDSTARGPATTGAPTPVAPGRRAGSAVPAEPPDSARLPSGTVVPVRAVGTTPGGRLAVPTDVRAAGWWRGGAKLGDAFGSTLLAAHIDSSSQGLGPYAELLGARPGQRIQVTGAHLEQEFEIRSLRLIEQGPLTDRTWLFSPAGPRRLTLVTCAPPYDPARGGYQRLAVVTAVPVTDPQPRSAR